MKNARIATTAMHNILSLPGEPVGLPVLGDNEITDLAGIVPSSVMWTEDRGNWAWDGALSMMRAIGIDVDAPLTDACCDGTGYCREHNPGGKLA